MNIIFRHCIPTIPLVIKPNPTVAPVMLCVDETGKRANVATNNHNEQPAKINFN